MNYVETVQGILVHLKDGKTIIIPSPTMLDLEKSIALYHGKSSVDGNMRSVVFTSPTIRQHIYDIYVSRYLHRRLGISQNMFM